MNRSPAAGVPSSHDRPDLRSAYRDDIFWADADRRLIRYASAAAFARGHRPRRQELPVHRGRPQDPRFHLRQIGAILGHWRPEVVATITRQAARLDDLLAACSPPVVDLARPSVRDFARTTGEGAAADHRRRVERSGHPDGKARHRQTRDRLVRPLLAWHDTSSRRRHLQRWQKRLRPGRARQLRHPRALPLPP